MSIKSRSISVLTWNIWFEAFSFEKRCKSIFRECETRNPDIICLQEVTLKFCHLLNLESTRESSGSSWLSSYISSDGDLTGQSIKPYGVMILCKKELLPEFTFFPFVSEMDRKLLVVDIKLSDGNIRIGTVHLESLSYHTVREHQLEVCANVLSSHSSILCGDFNFCSYRNYHMPKDTSNLKLENDSLGEILPGFVDMWSCLHPSEKGYTFDTEANEMLSCHRHEQMRYDRILYSSSPSPNNLFIEPSSIELIGTSSVDSPNKVATSAEAQKYSTPPSKSVAKAVVFPSDHFGLLGEFILSSPLPSTSLPEK